MEIAIPMPEAIGRLEKHLLSEFAESVEQWSNYIPVLTQWEMERLLDNPAPDAVTAHKKMVERLLAFGRFISLATGQAEFPDRQTAEMVSATQQILRDKLHMWHGPKMSEADSDRLLTACFPNES